MIRTVVNVTGDMVVATVVARYDSGVEAGAAGDPGDFDGRAAAG